MFLRLLICGRDGNDIQLQRKITFTLLNDYGTENKNK